MTTRHLNTSCVIVGGGPAGMMAGYILARAGVAVTVLEKHADFLRDFRGDTIHPSTLEVMQELGLLDQLLARPHQQLTEIGVHIGDEQLRVADFSHLPLSCRYLAFMPQWDFLDCLAQAGAALPALALRMSCEAHELIIEQGRVVGIKARDAEGELEVRADLVLAADGRSSCLRACAQLEVEDLGAPIDVLWLRLSKRAGDPRETLGRVDQGRVLILLDRGDYWQCAFVIEKGRLPEWQARGLPAFRQLLVELVPAFADRVQELASWDDIKLLTVKLDRLKQWSRAGLLCIGDAAHAMSPVGGVGINLAIQDAVACANLLARPLRERRLTLADLQRVQKRRELPARLTQSVQRQVHKRVLTPALNSSGKAHAPVALKLLDKLAWLRRLPGRAVGMGVRPEHVDVSVFQSPSALTGKK